MWKRKKIKLQENSLHLAKEELVSYEKYKKRSRGFEI